MNINFTLDKIHNNKLKEFNNIYNNIENYKKQLNSYYNILETINNYDLYKVNKIRNDIKYLEDLLKKVNNDSIINSYFLKSSPYLLDYYDNSNNQKATCLENYLSATDDNHINKTYKNQEYNNLKCEYCDNIYTIIENDSIMICIECGDEKPLLIEIEKPSYDDQNNKIVFVYKKIKHLKKYLINIQGKENVKIPSYIYDIIDIEKKKERIINLSDLTYNKIKEYFKKNKIKNKYHDHIPYILLQYAKIEPLRMTADMESEYEKMFLQVLSIWNSCKPPNRKNFQSCPYVCYQITKIKYLYNRDNRYYKFLKLFKLLKAEDKRYEHDKIWEKICEKLNWPFYPTI